MRIEPIKPRFIYNARYLKLMCKHSEFKMDGVGKIAQCSRQGAHQISMDYKSGFHKVPYTQIHGRISGCTGRECTTCGSSCVSDGVNHDTFTTRLVAPLYNTSATSTCLSPRGLTIFGCSTFEQLKLSHPHNNAKRRGT